MKPIQLMQIFYNDYYQSQPRTAGTPSKYYRQRANHTQNLTKFLSNYERKGKGNSVTIFNASALATTAKLGATTSEWRMPRSEDDKRCYFKNSYTDAHPFLMTRHIIQEKTVNDPHIKTESIESVCPSL
jgi:hypothetical protein